MVDGMLKIFLGVPESPTAPPAGMCHLPYVDTQNRCDSPVP